MCASVRYRTIGYSNLNRQSRLLALRICSDEVYQQDWPAPGSQFVARSARHGAMRADIEVALKGRAGFFKQAVAANETKGAAPLRYGLGSFSSACCDRSTRATPISLARAGALGEWSILPRNEPK